MLSNPATAAFLQQLGGTISVVGAVIAVVRRREIAAFFSTHASKWRQIQRLEAENAQLRSSLGAATLANEGFENRITQLSGEVAGIRTAFDALSSEFKTLTAKFTAGIAYIATRVDRGDTDSLPALIRDDVAVEIRRQEREAKARQS